MKKIYGMSLLLLSFHCNSFGIMKDINHISQPHLMPDLDGADYRILLQKEHTSPSKTLLSHALSPDDKIENILKMGQRNLEWLDHINSLHSEKIAFSNSENRRAYPIESPSIYNEKIIFNNFDKLISALPEEMKEVLLNNKPYTDNVPVDLADYLYFGLQTDYVYQSAARWKLMKPYLRQLKYGQANDIRSFYALNKITELNSKLSQFNDLSEDEKAEIRKYLIGICYNSEEDNYYCTRELTESLISNNGNATFFFDEYIEIAQGIYNSYFILPPYARRTDIIWSAQDPNVAQVPFLDVDDKLKDFLHNIELEWQWNNWQLVLNYVKTGSNVPHVVFEPGSTPHVNGLGGNQIVMDANLPLSEWDNQWTIRHEFGHVLGFPDCYVEFYDESLEAMVNYQIDVTNLMCSRKGRLQESHFKEMKKNYYKE